MSTFGILPKIILAPVAAMSGIFSPVSAVTETGPKVQFAGSIIKVAGGKPCVRKSGKYKGYFVNLVSLDRYALVGDDDVGGKDTTEQNCAHAIRLDAERVPGIVLPGGALLPSRSMTGAATGDVVVGYNAVLDRYVLGVAYDGGPAGEFGEASLAFNRTMMFGAASVRRPRTVAELNAYELKGRTAFLAIKDTRKLFEGNYSMKRIREVATAAFLRWAGTNDPAVAKRRLRACTLLARVNELK